MGDDHTILVRDADRAAAGGNVFEARRLLEIAASRPSADVDTNLRLAAVRRACADMPGSLAATEAALAIDPLNFVALLLRADLLERVGGLGVGEAYANALAQRPASALPEHLRRMVQHAERRAAEHRVAALETMRSSSERFSSQMTPDSAARLARFQSNAVHATKPFHSQPTDYHYPGLVEREFHDNGVFEWIDRLEAATDVIAAEFAAVAAAERSAIVPYIRYPEHRPLRQWKTLNNSSDWSAMHLLLDGKTIEENARHCPRTMALLATLPQPAIDGVSPNAMFSLLAPGAHIPPHTGIANTRLICHLPLIAPDGCWFRVGEERRTWKRGAAWVFDDTIEHEAANESGFLRVILIVDVWHPGLASVERDAVAATVAAHVGGLANGF